MVKKDKPDNIVLNRQGKPEKPSPKLLIGETTTKIEYQWNAPYPPGAELQRIDQVVPGGAKIIIDQYKKQSEHRRSMEKRILETEINDQKSGRRSGLYVFTIVSGLIFFCVLKGETMVAGILAAAIISLAGIFTLGKKFVDLTKRPKKPTKK